MKFINTDFFTKGKIDSSKKYYWLLLGVPKINEIPIKTDTIYSHSQSQIAIKDWAISAFGEATAAPSMEVNNDSDDIILTIHGTNKTSILWNVGQDVVDKDGHDCTSGLLVLAEMKSGFNDEGDIYFFEQDPDKINTTSSSFKYKEDSSNSDTRYTNVVEKILVAYDVNVSGMVNSTNYSGFTVGESIVTISGLFSAN